MALIQINRENTDPGATVLAQGELWLNLTNARLWGGTNGGNALLIDPAGGGGPYLPLAGGTLTGSLNIGVTPLPIDAAVCLSVADIVMEPSATLAFNAYNGTNGWTYTDTGGAAWLYLNGTTNQMTCAVAAPGTAGSAATVIDAWRIDQAGNFQAVGSVSVAGLSDFALTRGGGVRALQWSSGWVMQWVEAGGTLGWNGPSGGLMSLDGAGNLTTSGLMAGGTGVSAGANGVVYDTFASNYIAFMWDTTNLLAYVDREFVGTVNLTPSDQSLKENIENATEDSLATLRQIRLFAYDMPNRFDQARPPQRTEVGFIAQQLHDHVAEAVVTSPRHPQRDKSDYAADEVLLSVQLLPLLARAVGAIQQLADQLDALTARVAELEAGAAR